MAPSFGSISMTSAPNLLPPAAIVARTDDNSSAENVSFGFLPAASIRSKCWPMRTSCAFGKRWRIKTFSGIGSPQMQRAKPLPIPPFAIPVSSHGFLMNRARLDLHARPHGGGDRDALDVGALGAGGLGLGHG